MLEMLKESLKASASLLPKSYKEYSVDELMDMLCKAVDEHDEFMLDTAFSGVMLHYIPFVVKLCKEHCRPLKLDPDDIATWMSGAIMMATEPKNRKWQDKNSKSHAGTYIIQILNTRFKAAAYYESNLAMHKANYNTIDLDAEIENSDGNTVTRLDLLESDLPTPAEQFNDTNSIIQSLLDDNKIVEAIITETIAYNDCVKTNKKTVVDTDAEGNETKRTLVTTSFWPFKVVKILSNLPVNYAETFEASYNVDKNKLQIGIDKIKNSNNQKLYDYLEKTQNYLRTIL